MVRYVFNEKKEFLRWISDNVTKEKYQAYLTENREVILVPTRSTRPLEYAYFRCTDSDIEDDVVEKLAKIELKIYNVKSVEWADDRAPGVRVSLM